MVDWLKANPSFTMNDYLWGISVCMAKVMAADATHSVYLSEKQAKKYKDMQRIQPSVKNKYYNNADDFASALGI